jgi:hypothetical protein
MVDSHKWDFVEESRIYPTFKKFTIFCCFEEPRVVFVVQPHLYKSISRFQEGEQTSIRIMTSEKMWIE